MPLCLQIQSSGTHCGPLVSNLPSPNVEIQPFSEKGGLGLEVITEVTPVLYHLSESAATLQLGNKLSAPSLPGRPADFITELFSYRSKKNPTLTPTPIFVQRAEHFNRVYFVHLKQ